MKRVLYPLKHRYAKVKGTHLAFRRKRSPARGNPPEKSLRLRIGGRRARVAPHALQHPAPHLRLRAGDTGTRGPLPLMRGGVLTLPWTFEGNASPARSTTDTVVFRYVVDPGGYVDSCVALVHITRAEVALACALRAPDTLVLDASGTQYTGMPGTVTAQVDNSDVRASSALTLTLEVDPADALTVLDPLVRPLAAIAALVRDAQAEAGERIEGLWEDVEAPPQAHRGGVHDPQALVRLRLAGPLREQLAGRQRELRVAGAEAFVGAQPPQRVDRLRHEPLALERAGERVTAGVMFRLQDQRAPREAKRLRGPAQLELRAGEVRERVGMQRIGRNGPHEQVAGRRDLAVDVGLQGLLPLNPAGMGAVSPDSAFCEAGHLSSGAWVVYATSRQSIAGYRLAPSQATTGWLVDTRFRELMWCRVR